MPLVHLYRGELQRMTSYRLRLDTTTNWAVGTSAAVISFVLGNPQSPHFVLGLALVLNLAFAHLEARRYQRFAMVRARVRIMERGFYGELLGGPAVPGWQESLREHLRVPPSELSWAKALGARLGRNYLWIFVTLAMAWILKLDLQSQSFDRAATVGPVSGLWVGALVVLLAGLMAAWASYGAGVDAE